MSFDTVDGCSKGLLIFSLYLFSSVFYLWLPMYSFSSVNILLMRLIRDLSSVGDEIHVALIHRLLDSKVLSMLASTFSQPRYVVQRYVCNYLILYGVPFRFRGPLATTGFYSCGIPSPSQYSYMMLSDAQRAYQCRTLGRLRMDRRLTLGIERVLLRLFLCEQ
ncbi:hypothetical protein BD779DRAFT_520523 [Infundibulicybe gibba]|nr:hypothetical protein BD779DRAFT_520523 [Infundibulicybe gibba]